MASRIFISHASKDNDLAEAIRRRLAQEDYKVFSANDILLGEDWAAAISNALATSDAMVVLLSPEAVESPNVIHEISFALGSANYKGRIFPVLVRRTENIPWFLTTMHLIDVTKQPDPKGAGETVAREFRRLERRAG